MSGDPGLDDDDTNTEETAESEIDREGDPPAKTSQDEEGEHVGPKLDTATDDEIEILVTGQVGNVEGDSVIAEGDGEPNEEKNERPDPDSGHSENVRDVRRSPGVLLRHHPTTHRLHLHPETGRVNLEAVVGDHARHHRLGSLNLASSQQPADRLRDDPDVEESGDGGDVDGQLNVAPVADKLGNNGQDDDAGGPETLKK